MRRLLVVSVLAVGVLTWAGSGEAQPYDDECPTGSEAMPDGSCVCRSPDPALDGVVVVTADGEWSGPVTDCTDSQPPCGEPGAPPECAVLDCAEEYEADCLGDPEVLDASVAAVVEASPQFTG